MMVTIVLLLLMVNGKIVYAAQEERFSRLKGDYGFPKKAAEDLFKFSKLKPKDIDLVAVGTFNLNPVLLKIKEMLNSPLLIGYLSKKNFGNQNLS